ncbi:MAG: aldose 1-epimerase [Planctomycetota bacterium]
MSHVANQTEFFGRDQSGGAVTLYTLANKNGATMRVTDLGCTIVSFCVPDREGRLDDIVLGYDRLEDYLESTLYFGCIVGRFANRIANGEFELDQNRHELAANNAPNGMPCSLHGGEVGFHKVLWQAEGVTSKGMTGVQFSRCSLDGEEGFPGNLDVRVTCWLTDKNILRLEYVAMTDKATPVNLTHHSYFNLDGHAAGSILEHKLSMSADQITPVNQGLIPTGEFLNVEGTPFDFRKQKSIGTEIDVDHDQLVFGSGYDHNFVIKDYDGSLRSAAKVKAPRSGRTMEVFTTNPGIQFYTGNFVSDAVLGKSGHAYGHRSGFCLETQHFPDSPNQPNFPSTILRPGEVYSHITEYRFDTE